MLAKSTERLTFYVDPEISTQIRVLAATNRQNISDVIAEAVNHYLKNYKRIQTAKSKEIDF
jgi:predicted transcriptional regulator